VTGKQGTRLEPSSWIRDFILIGCGTLLFLWPAIANRFPLIFHDTNSYIRFRIELYRSIFYKLFVFLTGLHWTIWGTAIAQAALCSMLIFWLLRLFGHVRALPFLVAVIALAAVSSLPIFATFIMPDIFTGLMFLALFMMIFLYDRMTVPARIFLFGLLLLFISSHLSHLTLALAITTASTIALWRWAPQTTRVGIGMAFAATTVVAGCLVLYDGIMHKTYSLSPAGSVFLMANLIEYGPVRQELAEHCPQSGYRLCGYQDQLPAIANDFLWTKESPFNSDLGGFEGMRAESGSLVRDTLKHQTLAVIAVMAKNSARAIVSVDPAADIIRMEPTVSILDAAFRQVYGADTVQRFDASTQEANRFPVKAIALVGHAGLIASLIIIAAFGIARFRPRDWRIWAFVAFVFVAFIGNAVLCAAVSGVADRYQARMSWLIPLAALLLLFEWLDMRRRAASGN
jgi:hypothetical protein